MKSSKYWIFTTLIVVIATLVGLCFVPGLGFGEYIISKYNTLAGNGTSISLIDGNSDEEDKPQSYDVDSDRGDLPMYVGDTIPAGMVAVEDFRDSLGYDREMDKFYEALDSTKKRMIRVAYFGDSFIEGDILAGDLRECLQSSFGGKGVGFVDIVSITSGFKRTVTHHYGGWEAHSANNEHKNGWDELLSGISGRYFMSSPGAWVELKGQSIKYGEHLDTMQTATVYYADANAQFNAYINDTIPASFTYKKGARGKVNAATAVGKIGSFKLSASGTTRYLGAAYESKVGITVDNFSMRASNGKYLSKIPVETLKDFAEVRSYDLIIVHYGLNVAGPNMKNYSGYTKELTPFIDNIKQAYPKASVLVVSVSDRDSRQDGGLHTMPGIKELEEYQRDMAKEKRVAFWSLWEAMGGDGGAAQMKANGQANSDFTHINFAGGEYLGKKLFDVLMNGKKNYDKRMKKLKG